MALRRAAALKDIPEKSGLCVRIDGIDIGLFRVGDQIHALENQCPHAGDPLSEGRLEGPIIECAAHGWTFDVRTGFRPGDADGFPIPCFRVRIDADAVFVDLDEPLNRRPPRRPRDPG